jgi:hypothetical protein
MNSLKKSMNKMNETIDNSIENTLLRKKKKTVSETARESIINNENNIDNQSNIIKSQSQSQNEIQSSDNNISKFSFFSIIKKIFIFIFFVITILFFIIFFYQEQIFKYFINKMDSLNKIITKNVDKINPSKKSNSVDLKKSINKNIKKKEENLVEPVESDNQKSGFCYVGKINNKRSCAKVSDKKYCMSGEFFTTKQLCAANKIKDTDS